MLNCPDQLIPQIQSMTASLGNAYDRWKSSLIAIPTYLAIVASVAIYDIYMTVYYAATLKQMEQNPIGRLLMGLDEMEEGFMPNVSLFIAMKSLGTLIVLLSICFLTVRKARIGHPVAVGVSCFQLGLATYLTFKL